MMPGALLFLTLFNALSVHGFDFSKPNIECTVTKVRSTREILGFKEFPMPFQSINFDPLTSRLRIAGKAFPQLTPRTEIRTDNLEKISIETGVGRLELEIVGKPISRNGVLKVNGQVLADITCH